MRKQKDQSFFQELAKSFAESETAKKASYSTEAKAAMTEALNAAKNCVRRTHEIVSTERRQNDLYLDQIEIESQRVLESGLFEQAEKILKTIR